MEKKLYNLPKIKLSFRADFNIRVKIYFLKINKFFTHTLNIFNSRSLILKRSFVAVLVVLFVFMGTSTYAYASPGVTQDHKLYPLKQGIERVELMMAVTRLQKVQIYSKFAQKRIREAEILSKNNLTDIKRNSLNNTINNATNNLNKAGDEAEKINKIKKFNKALLVISRTQSNQIAELKNIAGKVGINTPEEILDNIAVAIDDVQAREDNTLKRIKEVKRAGFLKVNNKLTRPKERQIPKNVIFSPQESLSELKNNIEDFKNKLSGGNISDEKMEKLFNRLDKKVYAAEQAIKKGNIKEVQNSIKIIKALINNGRHFLGRGSIPTGKAIPTIPVESIKNNNK